MIELIYLTTLKYIFKEKGVKTWIGILVSINQLKYIHFDMCARSYQFIQSSLYYDLYCFSYEFLVVAIFNFSFLSFLAIAWNHLPISHIHHIFLSPIRTPYPDIGHSQWHPQRWLFIDRRSGIKVSACGTIHLELVSYLDYWCNSMRLNDYYKVFYCNRI